MSWASPFSSSLGGVGHGEQALATESKGPAASGLASRGIEDELFVGVAALEKLVRLSSSLKRKMVLATEAKSAPS